MEQKEILEKSYPIIFEEKNGLQLILDTKFRNGFYMEVYVIQKPNGCGYMNVLWTSPYKALAYAAWERYTV